MDDFKIKKNLPKDVLISGKEVGINVQGSKMIKEFRADKDISSVLDKTQELAEFQKIATEKAGGKGKNITKNVMRKTLGHFKSGKGITIDPGEAQKLSSKFDKVLLGKRYIFEKNQSANFLGQDRLAKLKQAMVEKINNDPIMNPRQKGNSFGSKFAKSSSEKPKRHSGLF